MHVEVVKMSDISAVLPQMSMQRIRNILNAGKIYLNEDFEYFTPEENIRYIIYYVIKIQ